MRLSNWVPSWRSLLRTLIPLGFYPAIWIGMGLISASPNSPLWDAPSRPELVFRSIMMLLVTVAPFLILLPVIITAYLHHWIAVCQAPWLRPGAESIWEGLFALQVLFSAATVAMLPIYYQSLAIGFTAGFENFDANQYEPGVVEFVIIYGVAAYLYHIESLVRHSKVAIEEQATKKPARQS